MAADSKASDSVISGSMPTKREANILLPVPGGPLIMTLAYQQQQQFQALA